MHCFNDKLLSTKTGFSRIRGRIRPNISEQLRPSLSLITSLVIMTWIIVGPGRIFPLVKIWVCLRAYRTSHGGWIKSCSLCLDGLPGIPLVAARAWVKWVTVGLDWFRKLFILPQGKSLILVQQLGLVHHGKQKRVLRNWLSKDCYSDQPKCHADKWRDEVPLNFIGITSPSVCMKIDFL